MKEGITLLFRFFSCMLISGILYTMSFGQGENNLIHPAFYDDYIGYQLLPGDGLRIFTVSDIHNHWTFREFAYQDIFADRPLDSAEMKYPHISGQYFYYLVNNAKLLHDNNGGTILANDFFDCDYGGWGGLFKLGANDSIAWFNGEDQLFSELNYLNYLDSNKIFIGGEHAGMILDDTGSLISQEMPETIFSHSIQTDFGFILSHSNDLYVMSTDFLPIRTYVLDEDIVLIEAHSEMDYLIKTLNKFYWLDSTLNLNQIFLSPDEYSTVWQSNKYFWGAAYELGVIKFDTLLSPLDTFPLSIGVFPIAGVGFNEDVILIGSYQHPLSRGVVTFKGNEDSISFDLHQDIGITSIEIQDSVLTEYFNSNVWFEGWSYHFDFVKVEVTNFGTDTVNRFYIQGIDVTDCFWWCLYPHPFWEIDSILLAPGESAIVELSPFVTRCAAANNILCLSTVGPNNKADGNYLNDQLCQSFSIVLETKEVQVLFPVTISPNPATDFIYFDSDGQTLQPLTVYIYDITGVMLNSITVDSYPLEFTVTEMPAGIYFIKLMDEENKIDIRKLVITH